MTCSIHPAFRLTKRINFVILINKFLKINDNEANERIDLINSRLEKLSQHIDQGTLFLGGASMIATDMMSFIKSDLVVFGVGVAIIFCNALFIFQNIWFVILPLSNAFVLLQHLPRVYLV